MMKYSIKNTYTKVIAFVAVLALILPYSTAFGATQPVWHNPGTQVVRAGDFMSMTVSASGASSYEVVSLPSGASFDASKRKLTWTPTVNQLGYNGVVLRANSNSTVATDLNFYIQVLPAPNTGGPNQAPYFTKNTTSYSVDTGKELRFTVNGADPDGDVLNYSAVSLPSGASFNTYDRSFYWKPATDAVGTNYAIFVISDGVKNSEQLLVKITVRLSKSDPTYAYNDTYTRTVYSDDVYSSSNNYNTSYSHLAEVSGSKIISSDDYFEQERIRLARERGSATASNGNVSANTAGQVLRPSTEAYSNDTTAQANTSNAFSKLFKNGEENESSGPLRISNIKVINPVLDSEADQQSQFANCDVEVRWDTNRPTVGQVLFGPESQAGVDLEKLKYTNSAMTDMNFTRLHGVKLGCLANTTYYFRIFAYSSAGQLAQSQEIMLVPFGGGIALNSEINGDMTNSDASSASVLNTFGRFGIPILFLLLLAIFSYIAVKWVRGKRGGSNTGGGDDDEEDIGMKEPAINIASGQS